ncbi:hypothetical protein ABE82_26110 (plasmid) [Paenibacillus peoriae]|uniref:helix-turn-helix domain-containing protein n=1 Tax=Paenibacillus peoriae TaxID=59893 RepID=UPI00072068EC|nr:helix-turn-helix domain-containing protein [Paenibacillus peoriae]ALS09896.1 hypothetical protein ABE82_26110 [Paenibacillus peoriae]
MSKYLGIHGMATLLKVSSSTIYKYVDSGKLEPINRSTYRGDGGYKFEVEDEIEFQKKFKIYDLTVADVARILNCSKAHVHRLLKEGHIKYYEDMYQGHRTYFIKKEDLDEYIQGRMNSTKDEYEILYDNTTSTFLFQPFVLNDQLARVVDIQKRNINGTKVRLRTPSGEISYEEAIREGWRPSFTIQPQKVIGTYGVSSFEFPKPIDLDSSIYLIIEELFRAAGPKNLNIHFRDEKLFVTVKRISIRKELHPDLLDRMRNCIQNGEIVLTSDGLLITPAYSAIYVRNTLKQRLLDAANQKGMNLEEYLERFCLPED